MLSSVYSAGLSGIDGYIVTVESSEEAAWKEIEKLEEASKKRAGDIFTEPTPKQ